MVTSYQVNVMVVSLAVIFPSSIVILKIQRVPQMMMEADRRMLDIRLRVRICSFRWRGGFLRTSWCTGSRPRLCAGGPSMITLIHKIWNKLKMLVRKSQSATKC